MANYFQIFAFQAVPEFHLFGMKYSEDIEDKIAIIQYMWWFTKHFITYMYVLHMCDEAIIVYLVPSISQDYFCSNFPLALIAPV